MNKHEPSKLTLEKETGLLNTLLADEYVLYMKTQNAYRNMWDRCNDPIEMCNTFY